MGRNSAIKRYDTHPEGQPMQLFDAPRGRLPVVLELLRSPWIVRGSDLPARDAGAGARVVVETAAVSWDAERGCPAAFAWRGRRYPVDAVVQAWTIE
ncbi:MAG: hypothetical protein C0418_06535, partial [Coriobacteriaceae bacterium]|nr:hypothetical protein [Coriobacteriaceae bacterium]